jgi:hypothetical protein
MLSPPRSKERPSDHPFGSATELVEHESLQEVEADYLLVAVINWFGVDELHRIGRVERKTSS